MLLEDLRKDSFKSLDANHHATILHSTSRQVLLPTQAIGENPGSPHVLTLMNGGGPGTGISSLGPPSVGTIDAGNAVSINRNSVLTTIPSAAAPQQAHHVAMSAVAANRAPSDCSLNVLSGVNNSNGSAIGILQASPSGKLFGPRDAAPQRPQISADKVGSSTSEAVNGSVSNFCSKGSSMLGCRAADKDRFQQPSVHYTASSTMSNGSQGRDEVTKRRTG